MLKAVAALALVTAAPLMAEERAITPAGLAGPLAGTLLRAEAKGAPVAVIIPGSGPTNRDGNSPMGVTGSSLRQIAEALAAEGVTTLRIDKRGMFGSANAIPDGNKVSLGAYAADAAAWAADARAATGTKCAWLIGHSEGGLVALKVAAERPEGICGVVALAAPGRRLGDLLREQLAANPANAPILAQSDMAIAALERGEGVDSSKLHPGLAPLFHEGVQDFLIDLMKADPAELAAKSALPLLILRGTEDLQVAPADADALAKARPNAKRVDLAGVNHVLKPVAAGDRAANIAAYGKADLANDPRVAREIARFIRPAGRAGAPSSR